MSSIHWGPVYLKAIVTVRQGDAWVDADPDAPHADESWAVAGPSDHAPTAVLALDCVPCEGSRRF